MKNITKNWKYLKNLFWGGPILIVIGLSAGAIAGTWIPIPLGLIAVGILVIIGWAILQSNSDVTTSGEKFWGRRSAQAGTNALIATIAVIAILGLINFVAARNSLRVDLTENQVLTIAPQSQQLVRNFTAPVKVWIFNPNSNPQDVELLDNYRRQNSRFSFEFVDPNAKPDLTQKFGVSAPDQVYLEYGEKRKFVQSVSEGERLSEVKLTNALQQIKSDRIDKIYFLQGHGELSLQAGQDAISIAVQSLDEKNYKSEPLNLAERGSVPTDTSLIVVARPKQALFEAEVNALRDYLRRGGSLLLMVDPNTNPGVDSLLQEWGVKLDNRLVINASSRQVQGFGPAAALVTQYGEHPITKDFGNRYSFYPYSRAIELIPTVGVDATPFLLTNDQSWAESNPENPELKLDPNTDLKGPLTLGIALSRKLEYGQTSPSPAAEQSKTESRFVIIGNSSFATDGLFGQQLNGDVFLNSVGWLSQRQDQTLSIRPKQANNRRINITPQQFMLLGWTAVVIVPLIGFIAGGVIWWKRR